jgi:hypothetical protein
MKPEIDLTHIETCHYEIAGRRCDGKREMEWSVMQSSGAGRLRQCARKRAYILESSSYSSGCDGLA